MLEMLALALVLSVFGGTVHHILAHQMGAVDRARHDVSSSRLRRIDPVKAEAEDEAPGPTWASFPRAF